VLHSRAGQRALRWLSVASSPHQIRIRQNASPPERAGSRPAVSPLRLEGEIRLLRWDSSRILGNLARADSEGRIEKLLDRYLAPIAGRELIAAANAIQGAADIALAKPHLADRIAAEILKVRRARYATPECRNVAAGHAIQALDRFFGHIQNKKPVLAFVESELVNPRPATRKKAEKFWARWAGW
jgi:hypothetical protein